MSRSRNLRRKCKGFARPQRCENACWLGRLLRGRQRELNESLLRVERPAAKQRINRSRCTGNWSSRKDSGSENEHGAHLP